MTDSNQVEELLSGLPLGGADWATRLAPLFRRQTVDAGEILFLEGELGGRFAVVAEGTLRAFRTLENGREITVFILSPGDPFGFLPLLDGGPYPVSVGAITSGVMFVLDRQDFLRLARGSADLSLAIVEHLARRFRGCLDQVENLGRHGAVARAAHSLLSLMPAESDSLKDVVVTLPFAEAELARIVHVTPENLSRALTTLVRRDLIRRLGRRKFLVPSPKALLRAADAGE